MLTSDNKWPFNEVIRKARKAGSSSKEMTKNAARLLKKFGYKKKNGK